MNAAFPRPPFDAELIARYEGDGPRYDSYPTAIEFHPEFDQTALEKAIDASNGEPVPGPLSLYVHVPFCRSPCFYCGGPSVLVRDSARADALLRAIASEAALIGPRFDADRQILKLHLGGGTPTCLDLPRMTRLLQTLREHFAFAPVTQREFGIEIDPRLTDAEYIRGLAALGFNRLSAVIEDFEPAAQQAGSREQNIAQARLVLHTAREAGFQSISIDLIYGLASQTLQGFGETLDEIVRLAPDRIVVYPHAHLPTLLKVQGQIDVSELPSPSQQLAMLGLAMSKLTDAGYLCIGMDHFAKPGGTLLAGQRHGRRCSTLDESDIVGLGPGAISRIGDSYSQNTRDMDGYSAALDARRLPVARGVWLSEDDLIRRDVISSLMRCGELDMQAIGKRHGIDAHRYFAKELERLIPPSVDGLLTIDARRIKVQPRGRLLTRHIARYFDSHVDHRDSTEPARLPRSR